VARRGADAELLIALKTAALTGSTYYCGGWIDRRGGTVQPLSYVAASRAATRAGARIYVRSPAIRLKRERQRLANPQPTRSLIASTVILATDAYTDHLVDRCAGAWWRCLRSRSPPATGGVAAP